MTLQPEEIDPYESRWHVQVRLHAAQFLIHFLRNDWTGILETWERVSAESEMGVWVSAELHLPTLKLLQCHLSPDEAGELAERIALEIPMMLRQLRKREAE